MMKKINAFCAAFSGVLVCCLMVLLSGEILGRKLGYPIPGTIEFAAFALVGIIFLGLSHCEELGGHVRVEFLLTRFSPKLRKAAEMFIYLLGFCIYGLMTWQTGVDAVSSWSVRETVPGLMTLPVYPAKTVVPLGCALICIQIIVNAIGIMKDQGKQGASQPKADQ